MTARLRHLAAAVSGALLATLCLAGGASAAVVAHGVAVTDFATGFPPSGDPQVGPLGVAVDNANRLYVTNWGDDSLYRFSAPGTASPSTRLGPALGSKPSGLAFDSSGRLFVVRRELGDVLQLDPNTGAVLRTVMSGLSCPTGLANDPTNDDLYVTQPCATTPLVRIGAPASATPSPSAFGPPLGDADGLTIGPDGTIYVLSSGDIVRMSGAASPTAGQTSVLGHVSFADGIALGASVSGAPPYVVVNRNDGNITRVDLTGGTPTYTDLVNGGSRGDFVAVGFDGCLYATQSDRVLKLTNPDGTCGGQSTATSGLGPALVPSTAVRNVSPSSIGLPSNKDCVDRRKFKFKLHHAKSQPVVLVDLFVNGKRRLHKRGESIETVSIKKLPRGRFTLRIVATQLSGSALISTRKYKGCAKSRPKTRRRHRG